MPDFQEYHALRGVRDAKLLRHRLPHHPHDPVSSVHDQRNRIPLRPWDLSVHEEILQLSDARRAQWPEPVARAPASDAERQLEAPRGDSDFVAPAHPLALTRGR